MAELKDLGPIEGSPSFDIEGTQPLQTNIIDQIIDDARSLPSRTSTDFIPGSTVFSRALERGIDQTQLLGGAAIETLGSLFDSETLKLFGEDVITTNILQAAANPARFESFEEIEDFVDIGDFIIEKFAENLPNILAFTAGAGVGGAAAKVGLRALVPAATRGAIGKTVVKRAATLGAFTAGLGLSTGEARLEQEEAGVDLPGQAIIAGIPVAILDTAAFAFLASRLFPGVAKSVIKGSVSNVAKTFAKELAKVTSFEGSTEALQELIFITSRAYYDPTFRIDTPENRKRILEAGVSGAAATVPFGVFGGASVSVSNAIAAGAQARRTAGDAALAALGPIGAKKSDISDSKVSVGNRQVGDQVFFGQEEGAPVVATIKEDEQGIFATVNGERIDIQLREQEEATTLFGTEELLSRIKDLTAKIKSGIFDTERSSNAARLTLGSLVERFTGLVPEGFKTPFKRAVQQAKAEVQQVTPSDAVLRKIGRTISKKAVPEDEQLAAGKAALEIALSKPAEERTDTDVIVINLLGEEIQRDAQFAPEPVEDLQAAVDAVARGEKKAAFIDNITSGVVIPEGLEVISARGRGVLVVQPENKAEVRDLEAKGRRGEALGFVDNLPPTGVATVTVQTLDEEGRVIQDVVVEATPEKVNEAVTAGRLLGVTRVRPTDEVVQDRLGRKAAATSDVSETEFTEDAGFQIEDNIIEFKWGLSGSTPTPLDRSINTGWKTKEGAERAAKAQTKRSGNDVHVYLTQDKRWGLIEDLPPAAADGRQVELPTTRARQMVQDAINAAKKKRPDKNIRMVNEHGTITELGAYEIVKLGQALTPGQYTSTLTAVMNIHSAFLAGIGYLKDVKKMSIPQKDIIRNGKKIGTKLDIPGNTVIFGTMTWANLNKERKRMSKMFDRASHIERKKFKTKEEIEELNGIKLQVENFLGIDIRDADPTQRDPQATFDKEIEEIAGESLMNSTIVQETKINENQHIRIHAGFKTEAEAKKAAKEIRATHTSPTSASETEVIQNEKGEWQVREWRAQYGEIDLGLLEESAPDRPGEPAQRAKDSPLADNITTPENIFIPSATRPAKPQSPSFLKNVRDLISTATDRQSGELVFTNKLGIYAQVIMNKLGLKTQITLFDEDSASLLIGELKGRRDALAQSNEANIEQKYRDLNIMIRQIEGVVAKNKAGTIIYNQGLKTAEFRTPFIFLSNKRSQAVRSFVLVHEIGHLLQRVMFNNLSLAARKRIVQSMGFSNLGNKNGHIFSEQFANNVAFWAAAQVKNPNIKPDTPMGQFFFDVAKGLRLLFGTAKKMALRLTGQNYSPAFNKFMQAVVGVAKPESPEMTTKFGKSLAAEIRRINKDPILNMENLDRVVLAASFDNIDTSGVEDVVRPESKKRAQTIDDLAQRIRNKPVDAWWRTADSELRGMGPIGERIADHFHKIPGLAGKINVEPLFKEINRRAGKFNVQMKQLLDELPGEPQPLIDWFNRIKNRPPTLAANERTAITEALLRQTPLNEVEQNIRPHVKKVREYLSGNKKKGTTGLHGFVSSFGVNLGYRENYFPLMFDIGYLAEHKDEFVAILMKEPNQKTKKVYTRKAAEAVFAKLTASDGIIYDRDEDADNFELAAPGFSFKNKRKWSPNMQNALLDFYVQDIGTVLVAYTHAAVRRAIWQKRFGVPENQRTNTLLRERMRDQGISMSDPIARLKLGIAEGVESGQLNEEDAARIVDFIIPGYAGRLGLNMNPKLRRLSNILLIYQNMRVLATAIFSQFVDLGTMTFRTRDLRIATIGFREFLNKASRAELTEMARNLGIVRDELTDHVLNDQFITQHMSTKAKRLNEAFFRWNGMQMWTNATRIMGLAMAREFINHHHQVLKGNVPGDEAISRGYLAELNLSEEDVDAGNEDKIAAARNLFVDEAVIRPDPSIRPVYGSDSRFVLLFHLKGFLYGYHETFLRQAWNLAQQTDGPLMMRMMPFIILGALTLPLAAAGYEIRRKLPLFGSNRPRGTAPEYFWELMQRSGNLGVYQIVSDMDDASDFGNPAFTAAGGPTVEQFWDFFTEDSSKFWPKAVPLASQSRVMRDWLRDGGDE